MIFPSSKEPVILNEPLDSSEEHDVEKAKSSFFRD